MGEVISQKEHAEYIFLLAPNKGHMHLLLFHRTLLSLSPVQSVLRVIYLENLKKQTEVSPFTLTVLF